MKYRAYLIKNIENNTFSEKKIRGHENDILYLIEKLGSSICSSFVWASTEEGHDYWEKLNSDFELLCRKESNYI